MASIAPAAMGPDISRPGQQLLPTYAVKLLKSLKIPFGTDRTMNGVDVDPTIPLLAHIVDCLGVLRDVNKVYRAKGSLASRSVGARAMFGFTAELGNILLDSITFNPPVELKDAAVYYTSVGQSILAVFPEIAAQVTKQSGKMLIHHTALKASSVMALESLKMVLKANPASAFAADSSGATALHWLTHNPQCTSAMVSLLVTANPKAAYQPDNEGYLPLHWAVNQDSPSLEVVAVLLSVNPSAASKPCQRGTLPLHWAVNRDQVNLSVLQALLEVYPDGARTFDDEGWLPIHRLVNRNHVTIDALQWLIDIYPQALQCPNSDGHLPLHRACDVYFNNNPNSQGSPEGNSLDAIKLLIQSSPSSCQFPDDEGYLPLHIALDCAEPSVGVSMSLIEAFPQAANIKTKDGFFPLHCAVSAVKPPLEVVSRLVQLNPGAIETMALDIVPADPEADPETWHGAWKERRWTPLSRAVERHLDPIVMLFKTGIAKHREDQLKEMKLRQNNPDVAKTYGEKGAEYVQIRNATTAQLQDQSAAPMNFIDSPNIMNNNNNTAPLTSMEILRQGAELDASIDRDPMTEDRYRVTSAGQHRGDGRHGSTDRRRSEKHRHHGDRDKDRDRSRGDRDRDRRHKSRSQSRSKRYQADEEDPDEAEYDDDVEQGGGGSTRDRDKSSSKRRSQSRSKRDVSGDRGGGSGGRSGPGRKSRAKEEFDDIPDEDYERERLRPDELV